MPWNLNSDAPIFVQIIDHLQTDIISGLYKPGDKLPSVRDLAAEAGVNPNTMQKALSDLEATGLVHSERTSGRFITEDDNMIKNMRISLVDVQIENFFKSMEKLGFTKEEILKLVKQYTDKKN
ncbi:MULTISPECIES: GntR family transcriptional regulator [Butyrivibrio]|uniref:DNA-binding transcriptional regulator YhcF, GntR family n=1 Tax=Butyrivibrio hungatei TaxID=185008 RepID=A0A1G5BHC3_9FIRM|nr:MULTISPECIES: GntR family transcriptional regulator [Butyrivibrio]MBQ4218967.1 GntR family transcriptional regulator [Butyrivibrio sp.]MEE3471366.1 GntR family transcriptional regulator [Butyrivibrio hungatei]SCX89504.1 DNA-binding transcriptional regulator YhcF, GntR family [Butyrivibrio hungatei]